MYLTREDITEVLGELTKFEADLNEVFTSRGYDFRTNTGRRNALISVAQEREVAKVLAKKYKEVIQDGAPGKPDIYIKDLDRELECKLTSGSRSKGSSVSYALQTDWETLCNKGSLDYLYIISNREFTGFCVLFFEGLTKDDFFPPASGSRGKSRMNKKRAMMKATCLYGDYTTQNEKNINKILETVNKEFTDYQFKIRELWSESDSLSDIAVKSKDKMALLRKKLTDDHQGKVAKLSERMKYWTSTPKRYSFIFKSL
mgnify:CR=1 FL=1